MHMKSFAVRMLCCELGNSKLNLMKIYITSNSEIGKIDMKMKGKICLKFESKILWHDSFYAIQFKARQCNAMAWIII